GDQVLVVTIGLQGLTQGEKMLPPIISHPRFHHHLGTGLNLWMPPLRQDRGIALARQDGVQNCQPASPRDVTEHVMDLRDSSAGGLSAYAARAQRPFAPSGRGDEAGSGGRKLAPDR